MSISAKLSSLTDEQLVPDWWAGWLQFIKGLMTFYVRHLWFFLEENMKPRKQLNTAFQNTQMSRMWCKWLKVACKLIVWEISSSWEQFILSAITQHTEDGQGTRSGHVGLWKAGPDWLTWSPSMTKWFPQWMRKSLWMCLPGFQQSLWHFPTTFPWRHWLLKARMGALLSELGTLCVYRPFWFLNQWIDEQVQETAVSKHFALFIYLKKYYLII